jgi:signal peptidase I
MRSRVKWFLRQAEHILAGFGLAVLFYHACFDLTVITSGSMQPTLQGESVDDGDWVLTEKVSYCFRDPRRWEVVSFQHKNGMRIVKRVVGLEDEKISLSYEEKWVLINGAPVERPERLDFLEYYSYGNLRKGKSVTCDGGYFVFGDFSRDSHDSRFDGVLSPERITGRAWMVVWPLSRVGFVR